MVDREAPGNRLLYLLGMCGVCRQWRALAREVPFGLPIAFDGLDNALSAQATLHRFRKQPKQLKQRVFLSASKLLTGASQAERAVLTGWVRRAVAGKEALVALRIANPAPLYLPA